MEKVNEQRITRRLHFSWPVWFAEDFNGVLSQGQMADVSKGGVAFTCSNGISCPHPGREITVRFSVPIFGPDDSFSISTFTRCGVICHTEAINSFSNRIAVQFAEQLPFDPAQQCDSEVQSEEKLPLVVI